MAGRGLPLIAFWFVVTSVVVSSVSSGGWGQDVSLIIKYGIRHVPESASCVTGDPSLDLTSTLLADDTSANYTIDTTDTSKAVTWHHLDGARGVTCSVGGKEVVAGPLMYPQAPVVFQHLTVTLNKGEDLHLPVLTSTFFPSNQVLWQKEPLQDSAWNQATLTGDNKLFIPSRELQGSGLYTVIREPSVTPDTRWPYKYGNFHLHVRECPPQRYGGDCSGWCQDCLNGGVCDERSGECVCPAGVTGDRCQTLCNLKYIGRNCTVPVARNSRRHVVCLSAPLGCTCAPGFHGEGCDFTCRRPTWGVNCAQTCRDCYSSCDSSGYCHHESSCTRWGQCRGIQRRMYGEGDLGLPRLRQPPNVTSITSNSADVSFKVWQQGYDDGELPPGGSLDSYLVEYRPIGYITGDQQRMGYQNTTTTMTTQLTDLLPGMTYTLAVSVYAKVGDYMGTSLWTKRGRVHRVLFNTTCPNTDPPKPRVFSATAKSSKRRVKPYSLDITWAPVPYWNTCDLMYKLQVTSKPPGKYNKTFYQSHGYRKVKGLEPNIKYRVSLRSCYKDKCSAPVNTTKRTLPGEPGQVRNLHVVPSATSIQLTWDKPNDRPPRGKLESFRVTWSIAGHTATLKEEVVPKQQRVFNIQDLRPNTMYNIAVEAKNEAVPQYGAAATTTITLLRVPSPVVGLTAIATTSSSLTLTWLPPETPTGVTSWYNVSLHRGDDGALEQSINVTGTQAKLEGLSVASEYLAKVAACNWQHCSAMVELPCWTRPDPPLLQGSVSLVAAKDTTLTILLPLLTNPPGRHMVVMEEEGRQPTTHQRKDKLREDAVVLVREETKARFQRTARQEVTGDPELFIAAQVQQEGGERLEVTLGDNTTYEHHYYNRPLEKDAAYWVVVVTEKWSGAHVEQLTSVPKRFVVASSDSTVAVVGLSLGLVATGAVVACLKKGRHSTTFCTTPWSLSSKAKNPTATADKDCKSGVTKPERTSGNGSDAPCCDTREEVET